jgi:putative ABC transport system permease protein
MRLRGLYRRVRALLRSEAIHREIEEEMRFHIEMRAEENERAGMTPEEARGEAERRFGRLTRLKEQGYEVRGGRWLEALWRDCRYGARSLRKSPGFTLVAIATLTLGIGANTAIFSVVNAVLLRPLPYAESERLVRLPNAPYSVGGELSSATLLDWREQFHSLASLAAYGALGGGMNLTGAGEPARVRAVEVSTNFFSTLGITPARGRAFTTDEGQPGRNRVTIISDGLWRRLGSDQNVIGRSLMLNGYEFTIIGVAPQGFQYPPGIDLWVPIAFGSDHVLSGFAVAYDVIGRLAPGAALQQARVEADAFSQRLRESDPKRYAKRRVEVVPLQESLVGSVRSTLLVLFVAVCFVLLIACANVANLSLARATARRKEMSVRAALGAGRLRLVRQMLIESLLLALCGGAFGLLLAKWVLDLLIALKPSDIPRFGEIGLDGRVLLFTALLSLLASVSFGLAPALQSSKIDLMAALKSDSMRAGGSGRARALRSLLVVAELTMALTLLVGAGLLMKSFRRLYEVNPGFDPEHSLTVSLDLPDTKYPDEAQQVAFFQQAIERVRSLPGVEAAGASSALPFREAYMVAMPFTVAGRDDSEASDRQAVTFSISPDYFRAMGIPLFRGRYPTEQDTPGATPVILVSRMMAERYWPNADPIGQSLTLTGETAPREIIGVVGDVKSLSLERDPQPAAYIPYLQSNWPLSVLVVRADGDPLSLAGAVRRSVQAVDPELPLYDVKTMSGWLSESVARRRFALFLLATFAAVALALAALGIFGVISYTVAQRTQEIGIRMALGAQTGDVLRLIIRQGMALTICGVALGLIASFALTRFMESLLYGVSATDPVTLAFVSLLLALVALVACYVPARRAMKVDPMIALRYE